MTDLRAEQVKLSGEITKDYELLLFARAEGNEEVVAVREHDMNRGLEDYHDLLKAIGGGCVESSIKQKTA